MLLEGMQLGRYKLLKRIGGGGMGDVYLAEDPQIGQRVAIKVIKTEATLNLDTVIVKGFQEEARAIAQLDHPHIMQLLSYGEEQVHGDTVAYIVMPYRKEGNLIQWLQQRSSSEVLTLIERGRLIQQAASALKYAHDRNIIHRDVKPSNFLVRENPDSSREPDLLLSDFGLAKLMSATSSASQNVSGTPTYMAPEQWTGKAVAASDQYSLAVMAYELLAGNPPFQGNPLQMMHKHLNEPPPPPSSFNPSLPRGVDNVLLCALQKRPSDRYPSVASFAMNLLNALNGFEYSTNTGAYTPTLIDTTVVNTLRETAPAGTYDRTALSKSDPEEEIRTVRKIYSGNMLSNTLQVDGTRPSAGEGVSRTVQPISAGPIRSRPLKKKLLIPVAAAVIVLALVISSFALVLLNRNGAGNLAGTNTQSAIFNNSRSPGTHPTVHVTVSITVQPTNSKKQKTPGSAVATPTSIGSSSGQQPISNPTSQPVPSPTVQTQPSICLAVSTRSLALSGTQGQTYSNDGYFTITNCGSGAETWVSHQTTNDGNNWIRTSQTTNTLNAGASQSQAAFASLNGLTAGTYTGYLYYYIGSTDEAAITITLTVQPPALCLQTNPTSLAISGVQGQAYSNVAYFTITNCSSVTETWVSHQATNDGKNWIRTTQTTNTLSAGASQNQGAWASLNGLTAGTYTGYLYYYIGSTDEATVTITLTVSS